MAEKKFEFRRIRDFGENLGDSFNLIRQEKGSLLGSFFMISGIFILLYSILSGLFNSSLMEGLTINETFPRSYNRIFAGYLSFRYLFTILSLMMAYTAMQVALVSFIKAYLQNNRVSPSIEQVWKIFAKYFFRVFLYTIPVYVMIFFGSFFCLVPGIYFMVVFAPFALIIILEEADFGAAFSRCFQLIKNNFWPALLTYFIAYVIYFVCVSAISGLFGGVAALLNYLSTTNFVPGLGWLGAIINLFTLSFYIIPLLSIALHYFTLVEKTDGTGILDRISTIGEKRINPDKADEDY